MKKQWQALTVLALGILTIVSVSAGTNAAYASGFWEGLADDVARGVQDLGKDMDVWSADYQRGEAAGRNEGVSDAQSGRVFDADCPSGVTAAFCAGYTVSYADSYRAAGIVSEANNP